MNVQLVLMGVVKCAPILPGHSSALAPAVAISSHPMGRLALVGFVLTMKPFCIAHHP